MSRSFSRPRCWTGRRSTRHFRCWAKARLLAQSLGLAAQPTAGPSTLRLRSILGAIRYNRVEGVSSGVGFDQPLGDGYIWNAVLRAGTADRRLSGDMRIGRTNSISTWHLAGYSTITAANDWGDPFTLSSSLAGLLWAGDDAFYYRAFGLELGGETTEALPEVSTTLRSLWRLFADRQSAVATGADYSLSGASRPNIVATAGNYLGASAWRRSTWGDNVRGLRASTNSRLEVAAGRATNGTTTVYDRAALDLSLSRGVAGPLIAGMALGAGSSVGTVPVQRQWYFGGPQTVRGERADTLQHGNAYWLARPELAVDFGVVRPALFADLGVVGDRARIMRPSSAGRPLAGAGAGVAIGDGLVRVELARGFHPTKRWTIQMIANAL
jgi:hypothetical protein